MKRSIARSAKTPIITRKEKGETMGGKSSKGGSKKSRTHRPLKLGKSKGKGNK